MVKLYASEMANRVADRAVQIFGGRGYMRENVAERFFRELRVERIWEGTSEVQRLIVADQLAKRGRAAGMMNPSSTSPSMNVACSFQASCFRRWHEASQLGPLTIVTAKKAMT